MDDHSLRPIAPSLDFEAEELDNELQAETKQLADSYFHPAWGSVEQMFIETIEALENAASVDASLLASEYKIDALSNVKSAAVLKGILGRVKDAVEAVESADRTTKGAK